MIKRYTFILTLLFYAAFSNTCVFGQDNIADSVQLRQTTANMAVIFNKAIHEQSGIYNGPAFVPYAFGSTTNANYNDNTVFINGRVNYAGTIYTDVPLIYNINRDMLVTKLYNGIFIYTLLSERVYDFDLLGHHFIRLYPDNLNSQLDEGFYDELYNGKHQVLARRTKSLQQEQSVAKGVSNLFIENTDYFLKKGAKYYNINSEGKIYSVLKDKKTELKKYLKDNKMRYKDDPERVMAALAAYYDHLTN